MSGGKNRFRIKSHISSCQPFVLVAVKYKQTIEIFIKSSEKAPETIQVCIAQVKYFSGEHDPVGRILRHLIISSPQKALVIASEAKQTPSPHHNFHNVNNSILRK